MLLMLAVIILTAILLRHTALDLFYTWWRNHPPGPLSLPIVGGAWSLDPAHLPQSLVALSHRHGPVISVRLGGQGRMVFIHSLSAANTVLQNKSAGNRPRAPLFNYLSGGGFGLMMAPYGHLWRAHSRLAHLAFSYTDEDKLSQPLEHLWHRFSIMSGKSFEPRTDLRRTAFMFHLTVSFGNCPSQSDDSTHILEHMKHHTVVMETLLPTNPLQIFPSLLKFPNRWRESLLQSLKARDELLQNEYKKCLREQQEAACTTTTQPKPPRPDSVMEVFVHKMVNTSNHGNTEVREMFSVQHVEQTISGLMLAGMETMSASLEWIVLLIGAFPLAAERVVEEIRRVLGDTAPMSVDKSSLPYTEAWLRECLRFSSVTGLCPPHLSHQDLVVNGLTIPKGTPMMVNIWAIHHDPHLWTDPETFQPERFLDNKGQIRPVWHMPHYLPFSRGRRPCVGSVLCRSFLFQFLVRFLQKFTVTLEGTPDLQGFTRFGQVPKSYTIVLDRNTAVSPVTK